MVYLCLPINSMVMASMALNVTGDGTGKSVLSCVPLKPIQSPGKHKRTWPINSWAQHRSLAAMARGMGGSKKTSPKDGTGTALAYTIMYLYTYYMYTNIHIYIYTSNIYRDNWSCYGKVFGVLPILRAPVCCFDASARLKSLMFNSL